MHHHRTQPTHRKLTRLLLITTSPLAFPGLLLVRTEAVVEGWGPIVTAARAVFAQKKEWHIDESIPYPQSGPWPDSLNELRIDEIYIPPGETTLTLSMADFPGASSYIEDPGPPGVLRILSYTQEFETYVIGLEGEEGLKFELDPLNKLVVDEVTVYGGIKWSHYFEYTPLATSEYGYATFIWDQIGEPSEDFGIALREYWSTP